MASIVEPLTPDRLPALAAMLEADGLLGEDNPYRDFWIELIEEPFLRRHGDVVIARCGDAVEGVATASRRPFGSADSRMVFGWVARDRRRRSVGTALKNGMGARMAARGIVRQIVAANDDWEAAHRFLKATGFARIGSDLVMGSVGKPYGYKPVPGVRCEIYDGGDPRRDAAIADLLNRAFAGDPMIPPTSGEQVASQMAGEKTWMTVAIEETTGAVVGATECTHSNAFISIAVARRYWGTGLADWLGGRSLDRYRELGNTRPWALVRPTNRASLALLARLNWERVGSLSHYAAPTGPAT